MNTNRQTVTALVGAGLLWGTTVPLSKLALHWLPPGWLTFVRFAVAAAILLPAARHQLRAAFRPALLASGAAGYGACVVLQNAGITRTSVTHAALLIGTVPVLVAIIAAVWHRAVARPVAWAGFALSLAGVALVAGGRGGGASTAGDALVLASLLVSATFTVAQTRLAAWPGPHCRDCRAVPGGRARRAAVRGGHRGHARRPARAGPGGGHCGPGGRRHAAALRPVRLRAEPGARRGRRGVPQHRAVRRRRGGRGVLRRPCPRGAARRWRGRPRGDRAEQPPAAGGRPRGGAGVRR